jgi:ketosteroid isomerase-like protein
MPKTPLQAATLGGSADDTEAAFYEALQLGNSDKLMACWADEDDIVCVHPGGPRLVGAAAIRAAFEGIFGNGSIKAWPVRLRKIESIASAVHSVLERLEVQTADGQREAYVIATNVYHKTAQGWRLVAHHASPGTPQELQEVHALPLTLH